MQIPPTDAHVDFNERHAGFDKSSSHQQATPEGACVAVHHAGLRSGTDVLLEQFRLFFINLERLHLFGRHQVDGVLIDVFMRLRRIASLGGDKAIFDDTQH